MMLIRRMVRGNEHHRSRLHTERGQLLPRLAWGDVAEALVARASGQPSSSPWMAPAAVRFLEAALGREQSLLEFGAGDSTSWFAERTGRVVSLETDPSWFDEVTENLRSRKISNCDLRKTNPEDLLSVVRDLPDESYDVVVIDALDPDRRLRPALAQVSQSKVKPGGMILLDDSDRPEYGVVEQWLAGWPVRRFTGFKRLPLTAVETSIYTRPGMATNQR
jgi:predicted O-methyltransferase YrrM